MIVAARYVALIVLVMATFNIATCDLDCAIGAQGDPCPCCHSEACICCSPVLAAPAPLLELSPAVSEPARSYLAQALTSEPGPIEHPPRV